MVSSIVINSLQYFFPHIQKSSLIKKHHVSPSSPHFLKQKSLFLDLLKLFIKRFITSDFSKHVSQVMLYQTWKPSQIYCDKVYHICKSLNTSYIRVNLVKRNPVLYYISDKNHNNDSKFHKRVIILKVHKKNSVDKLLLVMFKFGNTMLLYNNKDIPNTVSITQLHNFAKLRKWKEQVYNSTF